MVARMTMSKVERNLAVRLLPVGEINSCMVFPSYHQPEKDARERDECPLAVIILPSNYAN
jgi:hypothetical protein